jgi:hypothetical protein
MPTQLTKHYRHPASILFPCPFDKCKRPAGVMCYGDRKATDGLYQHFFHRGREKLAETLGIPMPDSKEAWDRMMAQYRRDLQAGS